MVSLFDQNSVKLEILIKMIKIVSRPHTIYIPYGNKISVLLGFGILNWNNKKKFLILATVFYS